MKTLGGNYREVSFGTRYWQGTRYIALDDTMATARNVTQVDLVTQNNQAAVGRMFGWGMAGAVIAGPVGAIVGGIVGGNKNRATLAVTFNDGTVALVACDSKETDEWLAMRYNRVPRRVKGPPILPFMLALFGLLFLGIFFAA